MGPTASGKTSLAIDLVQHGPFEIISVDSTQVYRDLNIGSGKPDNETLKTAPHRLIDMLDPSESYSAANFRQDAFREIKLIQENGNIPLLVGGTMLYFKALRDGLAPMPAADKAVRNKILELADNDGWQAVHDRLSQVDPLSAARIHPNDPQRLQRALEVYELTGQSMTELHEQQNEQADLPFQLHFLAIYPEQRATLHQRIEQRFVQMLKDGFVDEVETLYKRGDLSTSLPSIRAVGYRQIWDYLEGRYDFEIMKEKALAATRQLAKRQHTWLRSWDDLKVIHTETDDILKKCEEIMEVTATKSGSRLH